MNWKIVVCVVSNCTLKEGVVAMDPVFRAISLLLFVSFHRDYYAARFTL